MWYVVILKFLALKSCWYLSVVSNVCLRKFFLSFWAQAFTFYGLSNTFNTCVDTNTHNNILRSLSVTQKNSPGAPSQVKLTDSWPAAKQTCQEEQSALCNWPGLKCWVWYMTACLWIPATHNGRKKTQTETVPVVLKQFLLLHVYMLCVMKHILSMILFFRLFCFYLLQV